MNLQVFGGDMVGIGDHRRLVVADGNLAIVTPCLRGGAGGGEVLELAIHLVRHVLRQTGVGGDQADAGAHIVFGLRQKIGRDHFGVAGAVGQYVDLGRTGQLVDPDRAENLPLRLVHKGIAGADDLVHRGHGFGAIGQRRNGLRPADPKNPVGTRQMTSGNHRRMRVRRQAGDDLFDARHLGRDDGHDRGGQQRIAPAGNVAADLFNRDDAVAQMHAGQHFDVQRADGRHLRLGKSANVCNREFGIGAGLRVEPVKGGLTVGGTDLERGQVGFVEPCGIDRDGGIAPRLNVGKYF